MTPVEYDVFICCREPEGLAVSHALADGLRALGFHVFFEEREAGPSGQARARAIEEAPDFILVMTPGALDGCADANDPVRGEVALAVRTRRIIVPVCLPGVRVPAAASLPPDIAAVPSQPSTSYDPSRQKTSIALVSHSLSSDADIEDRKLDRRARHAAMLVAFIFVSVVLSFVVPPIYRYATAPRPKPAVAPFAIAWAGFAQRNVAGSPTAVDVVDGLTIAAGDRLRFLFSPSADGFAYVLARDSRGDVSVLFPSQALRGASQVRAGQVYDVPAGGKWLTPDGAGGEQTTVYLIAGYDALENLEELAEDQDNAARAAERRELLESTVGGLVDGRHGAATRNPRTRLGNPVDARLPIALAALKGRSTLDDGTSVERVLVPQRGVVSTCVEIRLRAAPEEKD